MKKSTWIIGGATSLALAALLGWALAPRPLEVEVASVTEGPFETSIEEDGKTRLRDRYVVSAPLAALLPRITLREGDAVEAGALLATLTPVLPAMLDERTRREQQLRVEIAQAQRQRVAARTEGAKVALAQARNEQQRTEQLAKQGFVAPTKLETDRLTVMAAQKDLDAAVEEGHIAAHEVEQARAALLALTQPGGGRGFALRAPVAGRVLKVVQASEGVVALGAPILELGDTARLEVVAELLTADALRAQPGSLVRIERWGGDGVLQGRVRRVEPGAFTKVSALGVEEQRVRVLIDLTSPAEQWRALGDGFRVGVRIITRSLDKVLKVPVSAVFPVPEGEGGMAVFVLDGGRAKRVAVKLGARNGSEAWIESGVQPGTQVIVYPPAATRDGLRVKPRKV
ncbi:HlyD family efflux transporter periplasmic adaptor subunit [Rhizobacter sp. AJA081-3]|uniref:efflux RND transporter periplasmic adaptor subunit n=1 Tax=Rhizobacter sp. AJA081-3 TaxID=2753607 RepID=UPI001AE02358|nr:HlyD family efflux transporter periplasmic adaptor subunit [Rhizobacter sp. AJA081-3]QTN22995.1 HlyD family efflux transporter periplasmic adaptor subunit [Rhizobacter sp. AJA081-3]